MAYVRLLQGILAPTGTTAGTLAAGEVAAADSVVKTATAALPNARVLTDSSTVTWDWSTPGVVKASSSASAGASGTATLNFGSTPGTNTASVDVTGQTSIASTSSVRVWLQGNDSTADHNAYEHRLLAQYMGLSVSSVAAGVGFTIEAIAPELRLDGTLKVHWTWE